MAEQDAPPDPPPEEPAPEAPAPEEPAALPMLQAAIYGPAGTTGDVVIARSVGSDADYADLFARAAAKLRGGGTP